MEALVSIIIPAYNFEKWIGSTIESALAQTWKNIEVIVLITGDSDFLRLVKDCCEKERKTMICAFGKNIAWELKAFSFKNKNCAFQLFDRLRDKLEFK